MKPTKTKAHMCTYSVHPNPAWETHLACVECGFAAPKAALVRAGLPASQFTPEALAALPPR